MTLITYHLRWPRADADVATETKPLQPAEASSFGGNEGGPPGTGQCFLAFDTHAFHEGFDERAEALFTAILEQEGTRLPGERRLAARARTSSQGVTIARTLHEKLEGYAAG